MSEVVDFDTIIDLGLGVAGAVIGLGAACAAAGIGLGVAVTRLVAVGTAQAVKGGVKGFTQGMNAAVERLTPREEQGGVEATEVDGLRSLKTLHQACERIARERGGQLVAEIRDARGRKQDVLVGVTSPEAKAGIGVNVDPSGRLVVVADPSVVPQGLIDEFRDDLETTYTAIGVEEALRTLRYRYRSTRPSAAQRVIVGERT